MVLEINTADFESLLLSHQALAHIAPVQVVALPDFWGLVFQEDFLVDSSFVDVADELVLPLRHPFQMQLRHPICDIPDDAWIDVGQRDFALVYHVCKVVPEVVLEDALVDPVELKEVAGHEYVQAVVG